MKKIFISLLLIYSSFVTPLFAQEDVSTLSEEIAVSSNSLNFLSILFATLTPALLIIVAYLLIKMSTK